MESPELALVRPIQKRRKKLKLGKTNPLLYEMYREFCRVCVGIVNARFFLCNCSPPHVFDKQSTLARLAAAHYCKSDRASLSTDALWSVALEGCEELVERHRPIIDQIVGRVELPSQQAERVNNVELCENQRLVLETCVAEDSSFAAALLGPRPKLYAMPHSEAFMICLEHAFLLVNNSLLPIYFGVDFTYSDLLALCVPVDTTTKTCSMHGTTCPCSPPQPQATAVAQEKFRLSHSLLLYNLELQVPWLVEAKLRHYTIEGMLVESSSTSHFQPEEMDELLKLCHDPDGDREYVVAAARWAFWPASVKQLLDRGVFLEWLGRILSLGPREKKRVVKYFDGGGQRSADKLRDFILSFPEGNLVESRDARHILSSAPRAAEVPFRSPQDP